MTKFLRKLAKKELLIPHIDSYIGKAEFPDLYRFDIHPNKAPDNHFHPSGDCTPCARTLFAKFSGDLAGKSLTFTSHKNFMVGHFWHHWLQDILTTGLGYADESEVECKLKWVSPAGWTVVGAADIGRCYIPGYEVPYLIDFKTMNGRMFAQDVPEYVLSKWTAQVNIYMHLLGELQPWLRAPDQCIMVIIQKDTPHGFKEVVIDYDEILVAGIFAKWDAVWEGLKKDYPPVCDCAPGECPMDHLYA